MSKVVLLSTIKTKNETIRLLKEENKKLQHYNYDHMKLANLNATLVLGAKNKIHGYDRIKNVFDRCGHGEELMNTIDEIFEPATDQE